MNDTNCKYDKALETLQEAITVSGKPDTVIMGAWQAKEMVADKFDDIPDNQLLIFYSDNTYDYFDVL